MRCFILGAGASHGYAESPTKVRPPLAKGLFTAYNNLEISTDVFVRIGEIVNYVRDTRGVDPRNFNGWNENIEDFLSEIEGKLKRLTGRGTIRSKDIPQVFQLTKAYDKLIFLFASILNEIQNGPTASMYQTLVTKAASGDCFITFNWDCLLDRALKEGGTWSLDDGYGVPFKAIFRDGWQSPYVETPSRQRLLKLHGSTNWLIPYRTLNFQTGKWDFINDRMKESDQPVFCFEFGTKEYRTYQNRSRSCPMRWCKKGQWHSPGLDCEPLRAW